MKIGTVVHVRWDPVLAKKGGWRGRVVEGPKRRRTRPMVRIQPDDASRGGPWWVGVEKVEAVSAIDLLGELA